MIALKPESTFLVCLIAGFSVMLALWLQESEITDFFLLLFLLLMSLLRWRFPRLKATLLLDCILCIFLFSSWSYAQYALILLMFEGAYRRFYWLFFAGISMIYFVEYFNFPLILPLVLAALCGVFLEHWAGESQKKLAMRDREAVKFYELEHLQSDLITSLPQIERMTAVAERARIARDIHDNAGHEIVAAYISFQTARALFDEVGTDALELYDEALERLNSGVNKIRETAHNLQTVTSLGVGNLIEICEHFPACPVNFKVYGDTARIPVYVWDMLESCLYESLTNAVTHARPSFVSVELDATQHLVRLCIENDGLTKRTKTGSATILGNGLRNLRHRATAIGGSFSVDAGECFRIVCVIPTVLEELSDC